jgi:hypothetical protein
VGDIACIEAHIVEAPDKAGKVVAEVEESIPGPHTETGPCFAGTASAHMGNSRGRAGGGSVDTDGRRSDSGCGTPAGVEDLVASAADIGEDTVLAVVARDGESAVRSKARRHNESLTIESVNSRSSLADETCDGGEVVDDRGLAGPGSPRPSHHSRLVNAAGDPWRLSEVARDAGDCTNDVVWTRSGSDGLFLGRGRREMGCVRRRLDSGLRPVAVRRGMAGVL